MIRFKDKIFEKYSICPVTGEIFDSKTGEVQLFVTSGLYYLFNGMYVHHIMVHTFYGYKPGYVVHHLDENKLNNALSNLVYLSRSEHNSLHHKGKHLSEEAKQKDREANLGKHRSEKTKVKISDAMKGNPKVGHLQSEETKAKISASLTGKKRGPYKKNPQAYFINSR